MGCTMLYEYGKRTRDFFEAFLFFFFTFALFLGEITRGDTTDYRKSQVKLHARCPQKQKESSEITRAMPSKTKGIE